MPEIFAKNIKVIKVRNIENFYIPLSSTERKHLIVTGKNGAGKTSLLNEIKKHLFAVSNDSGHRFEKDNEKLVELESRKKAMRGSQNSKAEIDLDARITALKKLLQQFGEVEIEFNDSHFLPIEFMNANFEIAFFDSKRGTVLNSPTGIKEIQIPKLRNMYEPIGVHFLQYMVNLKAERSFANDDKDFERVKQIDEWFETFQSSLKEMFETNNLELIFDRKHFNFRIVELGKDPYTLTQLSDGYSAIFNIVAELIMRMEEHGSKSYEAQGIVLVDEIETHLHVSLQKKILPFLISFFPKIQFVVSTHSPFVISSIENAIICDLEKRIIANDLSGYSYDTIIESYFDSDKYSSVIKNKVDRYEHLSADQTIDENGREELQDLERYLDEIPKFISDELTVKLQQIKLKNLRKKD